MNKKLNLKSVVDNFVSQYKTFEYNHLDFTDSDTSGMSDTDSDTPLKNKLLSSDDGSLLDDLSDEILSESESGSESEILAITSKFIIDDLPKLPFLSDIKEYKLNFFEDDAFFVESVF